MRRLLSVVVVVLVVGAFETVGVARGYTPIRTGVWGQPGEPVVSNDGRWLQIGDREAELTYARDPATGAIKLVDAVEAAGSYGAVLSPDSRFLYLAGEDGGLRILRRDPATGSLALAGLAPSRLKFVDMVLTPDGRFAYAGVRSPFDPFGGIVAYARDPATGALSQIGTAAIATAYDHLPRALALSGNTLFEQDSQTIQAIPVDLQTGALGTPVETQCGCFGDALIASADGTRLYGAPGPYAVPRDPQSGALSGPATFSSPIFGGPFPALGSILEAPGGRAVYAIADDSIAQFTPGDSGLQLVRSYRDGRDGRGITGAGGMAFSPDGRFLYVGAREPYGNGPGTIAIFSRDAASDQLHFESLVPGPDLEGGPLDMPAAAPGISINDGAPYTNDPRVTLTLTGGNYEVSNDGGFASPTNVYANPSNHYPWTLASTGPDRLPKTVYARVNTPAGPSVTVSDDIVLDQTVPIVSSAVLGTAPTGIRAVASRAPRLTITAHDRLSGVAQMQVTRNRRHPGRWVRFRSRSSAPGGRGALSARVRDRAGNASRWTKVRRRR